MSTPQGFSAPSTPVEGAAAPAARDHSAAGGGARQGSDAELVRRILALRLRLLANMFRRPTAQVVGIVLGGLYAIGIGLMLITGIAALRFTSPEVAGPVSIMVASVVVLAFTLAPILFGIEDPLDPRTILPFGIPERPMSIALVIAAAIGPGPIVLLAACIALLIAATFTAFGTILGVIGAVVLFATAVLAMRFAASLGAWALGGRNARLILSVVGFLLVIGGPIGLIFFMRNIGPELLESLSGVAEALSWTPLGASFGAAAAANDGDIGAALLKLLIALATVVGLWFGWRALVHALLTGGSREAQSKAKRGLGVFRLAVSSPASAIAARSFVYFARDARYVVSVIAIIAMPLLIAVPFSISGMPREIAFLVPPVIFAIFLGWAPHNDVAYDSTAIWQHIVSAVPGWADRLGRLIPYLIVGVPLMVLTTVIFIGLYGDWHEWSRLPATLGLAFAIAGCGFGLSSISSALFPYPVVKPGESPFKTPQGSNALGGLVQTGVLLGSIVLAIPVGIVALPSMISGGESLTALFVGLGTFVVTVVGGVLLGGKVFTSRRSQILAASMQH